MRNLSPHLRTRKPTTFHRVEVRTTIAALPFTPLPPANPVEPLAQVVRPYVLAVGKSRLHVHTDRSWLGLGLLLSISVREAVAA